MLISLRPRFAEAILCGSKTVELRRRPVNAAPGTTVVLYSTTPRKAIVGTARLCRVQVLVPSTAWRQHKSRLGLTRQEFDAYLDGAEYAYLLHLDSVNRLDRPLHLEGLRRHGDFRPPQSFRYVSPSDPRILHDLVVAAA
ncbi:MAG: ASCH domain-containing protein [Micromonosporaceae bacterium]|nr:ASCH domain-containing protein [Micromonosporaceae bacterium]